MEPLIRFSLILFSRFNTTVVLCYTCSPITWWTKLLYYILSLFYTQNSNTWLFLYFLTAINILSFLTFMTHILLFHESPTLFILLPFTFTINNTRCYPKLPFDLRSLSYDLSKCFSTLLSFSLLNLIFYLEI